MGKQIVVYGFVITFAFAMVVYISRSLNSPLDNLSQSEIKEPRIIVEDFTIYKYDDYRLKSTLSGKMAHFLEPNVVQVFADIKAQKQKPNGEVETISCDAASALFDAQNLTDIFNNSQLIKAEIEDNVELEVSSHMLRTEYALYLAKEEILKSDRPVKISGPGQEFRGDSGFHYRLTDELLSISGNVEGSFNEVLE